MMQNSQIQTYQQCTVTVMDTTTSEITFDKNGVSNFVPEFKQQAESTIFRDKAVLKKEFDDTIAQIKKNKKGKYDSILGVSGGVDSTYLALLAKKSGLNPLCVHFDNGWNTKVAVQNIHNIINKLGFDLHTYVINWNEFKDIQLAYFKAGVIDLEVPTDQFIFAALYNMCDQFNIKYILSGNNIATESILPTDWRYRYKFDVVNLRNIQKKFGKITLEKLPKLGLYQRYYYDRIKNIQMVSLLNLVSYKKKLAIREISTSLDWKDYGDKHHESIFTRWYQGYFLPTRYNIDKRKAHLSNLILNKEITREEALAELSKPTYDPILQNEDCDYVSKKWGITNQEFNMFMNLPKVKHDVYGTENSRLEQKKFLAFRVLVFIPVRLLRYIQPFFRK